MGLGMALYARGNYDDAVKSLLKAADMNPSDSNCYLFLSKAYSSSPGQAEEVIARFKRFAELKPRNAQAHYYYAMSLWKGKRVEDPTLDMGQIESLLKRSLVLDSKFADAHLQLGNFYSDQQKYAESIPEYVRAQELNPGLPDIRYRLGQAYVRTGQKDKAQEQFAVYQKLREQHLAELERQRAEIRQFIYSEKNGPSVKQN
jgi:tetratricopeptide (TPR) repeat protein